MKGVYNMLDKIKKSPVLKFLANALVTIVFCLIIWPLLDYLLFNSIDHKQFQYSISEHVIGPIIFGFLYAGVSAIVFRNRK